MLPRISLITPSFQQAAFLEECLRSVATQQGAAVEHIVVDGGSSDGSAAIIEAHAAQLAWWCSEADGGQSAAINKGLARASGEVFGWLNSDDLLLPGALERVAQAFAADPFLLAYGGRRLVREADGTERVAPLDDPTAPHELFIRPRINQQSTFLRMDAVRAVVGVEEKLRYVMDLELWWQLLFRFGTDHLRFEAVDLAVFRLHGDSKTGTAQEAFVHETAGVLHGLCIQVGLHGMAEVLAMGHDMPSGLRPMQVGPAHMPLVRRMVLHFLLRWNHVIHQERQFHMMRRLLAMGPIEPAWLDTEDTRRLKAIRRQLRVPAWWAFRMGRKWKHLTR